MSVCLRFKGHKEKGPAKQRIRDDSAKPQISDLSTDPNAAPVMGGTKSTSARASAARESSGKEKEGVAREVTGRSAGGGLGSGPLDQATPILPLTSTITVGVLLVCVEYRNLQNVFSFLVLSFLVFPCVVVSGAVFPCVVFCFLVLYLRDKLVYVAFEAYSILHTPRVGLQQSINQSRKPRF